MELLPWKCSGKARLKDDLEMESGRVIRHAQEVCRGRRFAVDKDIKHAVLPFVRLLSITDRIFPYSSAVGVISCRVKVIRYCIPSLYSFLFSDIICLSLLFVPIKVFCHSVTKYWIRCAQPPNSCSKLIWVILK